MKVLSLSSFLRLCGTVIPSTFAFSCPNLGGVYNDDDYRMEIAQKNCMEFSVVGGYALSRFQYYNLVLDSIERPCFKKQTVSKFCKASWDGNELVVNARVLEGEQQWKENLKLVTCNLITEENCKYGVLSPQNVLRVKHDFGKAHIPRLE